MDDDKNLNNPGIDEVAKTTRETLAEKFGIALLRASGSPETEKAIIDLWKSIFKPTDSQK